MDISELFQKSELVPVIVQDRSTMEVLMLAYANREAVENTVRDGSAWFYSRSRGEMWHKGDTSGNVIHVSKIVADCDCDTLLYLADPTGPACHTGAISCFFNTVWEGYKND